MFGAAAPVRMNKPEALTSPPLKAAAKKDTGVQQIHKELLKEEKQEVEEGWDGWGEGGHSAASIRLPTPTWNRRGG